MDYIPTAGGTWRESTGVGRLRAGDPMTRADIRANGRAIPGGSRILLSIPGGFQLRQFVHSGVLDLLLNQGFHMVLVSPNKAGEGFTAELPRRGLEVRTLNLKNGPLRWRYWSMRRHLLLKNSQTDTVSQKMVELNRHHPSIALAARAGNRLFSVLPWLRERFLDWEHLIFQHKAVNAIFDSEQIDLVLLGSPGFEMQDAVLLHSAVRRRVTVISAVLSWDNLSSRGLINPQPDKLLVWSDHMKKEAIRLHGMPANRIVETGAPLYDVFANSERLGSRVENLEHLGLDPAKRVIFYGTNHAGYFANEIEVVRQVARWVEEDALGARCQLWIRLHPQAVSGTYKVFAEPYRRLTSERVKVEFPPVREGNLPWDLPERDLEHLIRLLRDADVVINTASTLSIDAAVLDRPVVCVAYDPDGNVPYEKSVRRYYDFTHMSHVVRAEAAQLARSPEDLRQKIIDYLKRPDLDREGRKRIVEQQFGRVDGRSAGRLADQVVAMALKEKITCISS